MSVAKDREKLALDAIKKAFGTSAGGDDVNLFVEHHLEELPKDYWQKHLASDTPNPSAVVGLLEFSKSWGENDIEYFDFTLPGGVTDYVVSVRFNKKGGIKEISMES
jgi:hypothetical protein